jgi:hypothetical protein
MQKSLSLLAMVTTMSGICPFPPCVSTVALKTEQADTVKPVNYSKALHSTKPVNSSMSLGTRFAKEPKNSGRIRQMAI